MLRRTVSVAALISVLSFPTLAGVPAVASQRAAAECGWVQVGSYTPPFRRMHPAMAFDGTHTLLFGGSVPGSRLNGTGRMDDTWSFTGTAWIRRNPASSPPARLGARAAWDATRKEVVLFGGMGASGHLADTWTWDGITWTQEQPAHSPPARVWAGMAYDAATGKVVLFGGSGSDGITLGDTWTWDGLDWTQVLPVASPAPRALFGFADGSATSAPVLFGGVSTVAGYGGPGHGDTWTWDGPNATWTPQPAAEAPIPRLGLQMAYDASLGKTVLYGGTAPFWPHAGTSGAGTSTKFDDTWTWDGAAWTLIATGGTPRDVIYGAMAYDPITTKTYVVGGVGDRGFYDDIWSFDGTTWTDPDRNAPGEMQSAMLARESSGTNSAILFGGQNKHSGYERATWRWDGARWHLLSPANSPPPRGMASMAFDPGSGTTVLFGGQVDTLDYPGPRQIYEAADTWTWDGDDWTDLQPETSPPARSSATMVYDAARDNIVLFGGGASGFAKDDTWVWDGETWTEHHPPTSPPARYAAAMTYDPVRQEVVLFGGSLSKSGGRLDDTWTWDGMTWTEETPATRPPAVAFGAMAYDPRSESAVLFGGCDPCFGPGSGETWSWDGSDWTLLEPADAPSGRTTTAMVSGDAWEEDGETRSRPLLLFGGRRPVGGYYDEGTDLTADLWAFNAPELVGGAFHVYGPGR